MGVWGGNIIEPLSLSTVVVDELAAPVQSPTEEYTEKGFKSTLAYKVVWADRHKFCQLVMGSFVGGSFALPLRYTEYPAALATGCKITGFGKPQVVAGKMAYDFAIVEITFSTRDWENESGQSGEVLISESMEGAAEFLTIPAEGLYWDKELTQKLTDAEAPGKIYKTLTWNYTIQKAVSVPDFLWDLVGSVNAEKLKSHTFNRTFEPETLLFNPPSVSREVTSNGARMYQISLHATYRKDGWNKFTRKGAALPQYIWAKVQKKVGNVTKEVIEPFKPYEPMSWSQQKLMPKG